MKVIIMAAATICGRIGPGLTGSGTDRLLLEKMRGETDASLQGAETLRQGDPEMRGPGGVLSPRRIRAFLSGSGDIPVEGRKVFSQGPPPLIFTAPEAEDVLARRLAGRAEIVSLPPGPCGLSLGAALTCLEGRGVCSLLVEGGGRLNYACLREGLVNEIYLTVTPKLSGDRDAALFCSGPGPLGWPFLGLVLVSCEAGPTGEVFLRYRVENGKGY